MRIARIEPIAVSFPMLKPVHMAGEEIRSADNVLVRIESEEGIVGWGEAASAPRMTGETVASMMAALQYLMPALYRCAADDIPGALRAMASGIYANYAAKAAVEIAMHDLVGRATNRPVHALLGPKRRSRMPTLCVIGTGDAAADVREAEQRRAMGCVAYKIKVGIDSPERDAERTRLVCRTLGPGFLISADANQGWSAAEAVRYSRAVAGAGLNFFEQPVAADDLAGMAAVAAASSIPIAADEGIHALDDIRRHYERKAARGVSLKAIKLGGMRRLVEAAGLASALGLEVNISCKTGESSIGSAAEIGRASCRERVWIPV